jgi:hypothetical protein
VDQGVGVVVVRTPFEGFTEHVERVGVGAEGARLELARGPREVRRKERTTPMLSSAPSTDELGGASSPTMKHGGAARRFHEQHCKLEQPQRHCRFADCGRLRTDAMAWTVLDWRSRSLLPWLPVVAVVCLVAVLFRQAWLASVPLALALLLAMTAQAATGEHFRSSVW